jgi:hypothetical protein
MFWKGGTSLDSEDSECRLFCSDMANSSGGVSKISSSSKGEVVDVGGMLASRGPLCNILLDSVVHELRSYEMLHGSALDAGRRVSDAVRLPPICTGRVSVGLSMSCVAVPVGTPSARKRAGASSVRGED